MNEKRVGELAASIPDILAGLDGLDLGPEIEQMARNCQAAADAVLAALDDDTYDAPAPDPTTRLDTP